MPGYHGDSQSRGDLSLWLPCLWYNALLTMRLDREQLKVLAAMDDPLEAVRSAWASAQDVGQEEEFSHTLFEICEQTAQEQTMRMK